MVYFYDNNKRYIGCRQGNDKPANSTDIPVILADGQEAHFIDGAWIISDIVIEPVAPPEPDADEELAKNIAAAATIAGLKDALLGKYGIARVKGEKK